MVARINEVGPFHADVLRGAELAGVGGLKRMLYA